MKPLATRSSLLKNFSFSSFSLHDKASQAASTKLNELLATFLN